MSPLGIQAAITVLHDEVEIRKATAKRLRDLRDAQLQAEIVGTLTELEELLRTKAAAIEALTEKARAVAA